MGVYSQPESFEDLPPPYSAACPLSENHRRALEHYPQSYETFDAIQQRIRDERHTLNIWCDREGATIASRDSGNTFLKVEISNSVDNAADIRVLRGGCQVAQARISNHMHDFGLYIGSQSEPAASDWKIVKCVRGNIMHSDSYHFHIGARKLALKKTHDSANGVSKIGKENWKLVDESDVGKNASEHKKLNPSAGKIIVGGNVMAVYVREYTSAADEHSPADFHGRMDWREEFGEEIEIGTLTAMMAIWEKKRRHS